MESTISLSPSRMADRFGFQGTVYSKFALNSLVFITFCPPSKSVVCILVYSVVASVAPEFARHKEREISRLVYLWSKTS